MANFSERYGGLAATTENEFRATTFIEDFSFGGQKYNFTSGGLYLKDAFLFNIENSSDWPLRLEVRTFTNTSREIVTLERSGTGDYTSINNEAGTIRVFGNRQGGTVYAESNTFRELVLLNNEIHEGVATFPLTISDPSETFFYDRIIVGTDSLSSVETATIFYRLELRDTSGILKVEIVPVKRKSDGVLGLLDKISGKFVQATNSLEENSDEVKTKILNENSITYYPLSKRYRVLDKIKLSFKNSEYINLLQSLSIGDEFNIFYKKTMNPGIVFCENNKINLQYTYDASMILKDSITALGNTPPSVNTDIYNESNKITHFSFSYLASGQATSYKRFYSDISYREYVATGTCTNPNSIVVYNQAAHSSSSSYSSTPILIGANTSLLFTDSNFQDSELEIYHISINNSSQTNDFYPVFDTVSKRAGFIYVSNSSSSSSPYSFFLPVSNYVYKEEDDCSSIPSKYKKYEYINFYYPVNGGNNSLTFDNIFLNKNSVIELDFFKDWEYGNFETSAYIDSSIGRISIFNSALRPYSLEFFINVTIDNVTIDMEEGIQANDKKRNKVIFNAVGTGQNKLFSVNSYWKQQSPTISPVLTPLTLNKGSYHYDKQKTIRNDFKIYTFNTYLGYDAISNEFIPVRDLETDKIGLYDTCTRIFYPLDKENFILGEYDTGSKKSSVVTDTIGTNSIHTSTIKEFLIMNETGEKIYSEIGEDFDEDMSDFSEINPSYLRSKKSIESTYISECAGSAYGTTLEVIDDPFISGGTVVVDLKNSDSVSLVNGVPKIEVGTETN